LYGATGGKGVIVPMNYSGFPAYVTDILQMALLCSSSNSAALQQRRWFVHCIPDTMVSFGEFNPSTTYRNALSVYLDHMRSWWWLGYTATGTQVIMAIDATGKVITAGAHTFTQGTWVTISRTTLTNGQRKGGRFRVKSTGPLATEFTLEDWQWGAAAGGRVYIKGGQLYQIGAGGAQPAALRIGTRKVGRPFFVYRGRRSRRPR
jgi:hypothetical protein